VSDQNARGWPVGADAVGVTGHAPDPDPPRLDGAASSNTQGPPVEDAGAPGLRAALEAVLLVADEPIPATTLAHVLERSVEQVEASLTSLAEGYVERGSGFDLRCLAGGWRFFTREDCSPYVERFVLDGQQARLTQAALETLAVIAYREPVTRSRVSAVRGVNVDGVVRTLVARGLVAESGHDASSGAVLYSTTALFLERLGLRSRDELPSLAPLLPELSELADDSTSS
jgi:segregation and condensation protein B